MLRRTHQKTREFLGVKELLTRKGIRVNDLYEEAKTEIGLDISMSTFYNFIRGEHFSRNAKLINWTASKVDLETSVMLEKYYTKIGESRCDRKKQTPREIRKREVSSKLKELGGDW